MAPVIILFVITLTTVISSDLCPASCRCEDEHLRASCVFASLDVVPYQLNPEIHHLDLSNNRIASLQHEVGLYNNLVSLDLSSNIIHTLGYENFQWLENLITLNVSNNAVRNITKKSLKGLISLRNLDLSNNNITDLEEQSFHSTNKLEYLNLSGNSLMSLPEGLLNNLPSIIILDLSRNSLLEMPSSNLLLTPTLINLNLANNLIETIPPDSLSTLSSLKHLNLANNLIKSIADNAFQRLKILTYLNLEENRLSEIPTPALSNLNVLSILILSKNRLVALESLAFRKLLELQYLDLRGCRIRTIDGRAFTDNVNLETIYLDGNRELEELPPKVLYGSYQNLRTVSLRHCSLSTLQPTQFPLDHLTTFRVGGNPLVCNCSVQWLWNVIHTDGHRNVSHLNVDSSDILCADEEFYSKPLIALSEGALKCRMSSLYLSLSAVGCLVATGTILGLIAYVTRGKRQKRPSYSPPNRPELLVYVEPNNDTAKNQPRLIPRKEEDLYDIPHGKTNGIAEGFYEAPYCNRNNSIEGVYAVADVTDLRDAPPEELGLYRMHSPKPSRTRRLPVSNGDYNYDYEYRPSQKPHVVFV
ncbi:leucine-rich repeats and immunoglobulin-like domains protein 3 [Diachasmimorpha longicaudata]|uniref:leucine-rich repeats and immunoglobulin-like domains protein 3 n=1 Tax=Diachasmimorpha longicaudata TaxID=58733 RepID=UPI0030B8A7D2